MEFAFYFAANKVYVTRSLGTGFNEIPFPAEPL